MSRVFLAVPLADETRHALAAAIRQALPDGVPGRPVRPQEWHLTLRFLGEVDAPTLDRVMAAMDGADLGPRFTIRLSGLGAFPKASAAQVLWVGMMEGAERVTLLAERADEALVAAGLEPQDRPYRPHLTVTRLRPSESVRHLIDGAGTIDVRWKVDRVVLYETRLRRGGAKYRELEEFPLGE
ncbi:MAG TPA: RNA 2',3'-cyclic phosphodiesterase [Acidimicrobiia bacterium]|nr:RNA 2',3'-cyclic phosphodiesterase [Acidimicrobiia bacterium]